MPVLCAGGTGAQVSKFEPEDWIVVIFALTLFVLMCGIAVDIMVRGIS